MTKQRQTQDQPQTQEEFQGTEEDRAQDPEAGQAAPSAEELVELCREQVCPECPEKQSMDEEIMRVRADADNFRKRMSREKEQFCRFANESLLEDIIPVLDNLELAVGHGRKVEACQDLVQGVEMTIRIFLDTLKKHGLQEVDIQEGQSFDPAWHEAMAEEAREGMEPGQVCQVLQKGYTLNDRLLRPAKVTVAKKC